MREVQVRNPYAGKDWWRKVRLPRIEGLASEEIARYEARVCKIETPWIPVDKLVERLWQYDLLYDDPERHGAVRGALAVVRPDIRLVVVSDRLEHQGRLLWNAGHEGGHIVLHVPPVNDDPNQGSFSFGCEIEARTGERSVYCRDKACGFVGGTEEPHMYREAEYFAGCVLMPRDRYLPLAEKRLIEALGELLNGSGEMLRLVERSPVERARVYTKAVDRAVRRLAQEDLAGTVSMQAQRIRMSERELGLIRKVTDDRVIVSVNAGGRLRYERDYYEFGEDLAVRAARALGLDFSLEWRGADSLAMA